MHTLRYTGYAHPEVYRLPTQAGIPGSLHRLVYPAIQHPWGIPGYTAPVRYTRHIPPVYTLPYTTRCTPCLPIPPWVHLPYHPRCGGAGHATLVV